MRPKWRTLALALTSALLAGGLFAVYLHLAHFLRGGDRRASLDPPLFQQALSVALLSGLTACLAASFVARRSRRLLELACQRTAAVRANPTPHVLAWPSAPMAPELEPLTRELEAVAACYRRALDRVSELEGRLEALEAPDRAPPDPG